MAEWKLHDYDAETTTRVKLEEGEVTLVRGQAVGADGERVREKLARAAPASVRERRGAVSFGSGWWWRWPVIVVLSLYTVACWLFAAVCWLFARLIFLLIFLVRWALTLFVLFAAGLLGWLVWRASEHPDRASITMAIMVGVFDVLLLPMIAGVALGMWQFHLRSRRV